MVSDSTVNEWLWHIVIDSTTGGDSTLWTNRADGAWSYSDTSATQEALALKYPAAPNDSYPYYDLTVTVVSTDVAVTVPAGEFTCYYYELDAPIIDNAIGGAGIPIPGLADTADADDHLVVLSDFIDAGLVERTVQGN